MWNNFAVVFQAIKESPCNPTALNYFEQDEWHPISTSQFIEEVECLALALVQQGLKRGERVAIMALPSPQWIIASFAVLLAGGILVPLYPDLSEEHFYYEVQETECTKVFADKRCCNNLQKIFTTVIDLDRFASEDQESSYAFLLKNGKEILTHHPRAFDELKSLINDQDLAMILYTSSTTGTPKGVELTHRSLTLHTEVLPLAVGPHTRYLSILPLAHILGFHLNLTTLSHGASVFYFNDLKNLRHAYATVHPTMACVVPRLLEKVYSKMQAAVQQAGIMKRILGEWAFDLAHQESDSLLKYLVHPLVDKIVYTHLRESLGGSLEAVICGGATLDPHLNHFFQTIGVPIYEGWGLTEACAVTFNKPGAKKLGSVGRPVNDDIKIKISPEGEILVKGSLVMRGYYRNKEATKAAFDEEGWLRTGDKGEIDSEGFLTLHGRFKELYKTSTGEWVAPGLIEQKIARAPLVEVAMVVAEGRKFASVVLFANQEVLETLKTTHGLTHLSDEEFLASPFVRQEMDSLLKSVNENLDKHARIHAYCFIPHPPSIAEGEMTPSMKLRREVIMKKYKSLIDRMYGEGVAHE